MKHTLHIIGWIGGRRCYLDISIDEAKRRYYESVEDEIIDDGYINTITFEDEFVAYDVWEV